MYTYMLYMYTRDHECWKNIVRSTHLEFSKSLFFYVFLLFFVFLLLIFVSFASSGKVPHSCLLVAQWANRKPKSFHFFLFHKILVTTGPILYTHSFNRRKSNSSNGIFLSAIFRLVNALCSIQPKKK